MNTASASGSQISTSSALSIRTARPSNPAGLPLYELIGRQADQRPEAIALEALGRQPLTYRGLETHIHSTVETLSHLHIGPSDRVALIAGNGAEMASAFLAVSACATCAPLNPAYTAQEIRYYLADLGAKAIIVQHGLGPAARGAAREMQVPVIELEVPADSPAGIFRLLGQAIGGTSTRGYARADDIALLLHTSGTTSKPKLVPLTHRNLSSSAGAIGAWLELTPADRCLNIMPLFHIHGLVGALLASLTTGGRIICTPGLLAPQFFGWLDTYRPTWYTGVPTMHQSIVARGGLDKHQESIRHHSLRFARSCSSPLPPQVMRSLEGLFHVPVVEAYGMTEASHQISSNPLPPGTRKAGSVGLPTGVEVGIMDASGNLLAPNTVGEIVIQGPSVMAGYEQTPPTVQTFTNGWFHTGDQGLRDTDGYLFITGRLKELINRAGEKISPREVDEVLLDHPAVAQAVTFALPDEQWGESVAAAVIVRDGATVTEQELRAFAAARLAYFKLPTRILFVEDIPKGPTGKIQRIGLWMKFEQLALVRGDQEHN